MNPEDLEDLEEDLEDDLLVGPHPPHPCTMLPLMPPDTCMCAHWSRLAGTFYAPQLLRLGHFAWGTRLHARSGGCLNTTSGPAR